MTFYKSSWLVCLRYAYQNCNFEPNCAYKRYAYKKMSVSYSKLINFREDFFLRAQVKESFYDRFYLIIIFTNILV